MNKKGFAEVIRRSSIGGSSKSKFSIDSEKTIEGLKKKASNKGRMPSPNKIAKMVEEANVKGVTVKFRHGSKQLTIMKDKKPYIDTNFKDKNYRENSASIAKKLIKIIE